MSFSVHTFETQPSEANLSFSFHEKVGEGGELFFLGKFPESTKDAKMIAEAVFGNIVNVFQTSKIQDPYDKFEEALKAANMEAKKYANQMSDTPDIVVAFFDFHNLYLSQSGISEAYLLRDTNVSQISETPENGEDLFLNILNGQVSLGDTILLATQRILRTVTTNQLVDIFSRSDFGDSANILRQELTNNSKDDYLITALGIGQTGNAPAAGFLSRMMPKKQGKSTSAKASVDGPEEETEEAPQLLDADEIVAETEEKVEFVEPAENYTPRTTLRRGGGRLAPLMKLKPIFLQIKDLVSKVRGPLSSKLSAGLFGMKGGSSKKLVKIAGAVLGVLILGIFIRAVVGYESAETKQLREELSIAREALQQADTLLLQGDRTQAAQYLQKAKTSVQSVLGSKSKTFRSDAQFLLADIQEKQLQVENARKVSPVLLADIGVKNDNVESMGLLNLRGNLFVHDLKKVYKTIRNIVEKGLAISEKESIIAATTRKDQNTILFLTDTPRIVEYRDGVISPMGTSDDSWKRGIGVNTYGRFAYLLDPVENQIWKYERKRDQYSGAIPYNQGADLSRAVSFSIDGSVFILSDDGTIQKLFRGEKQDYAFRDMPTTGIKGQNLRIYTNKDLDFLYILDPDNARILVFVKGEKLATYKKQVIYDIPDARDFVVDDLGQKINLLTKDKIYEFSL